METMLYVVMVLLPVAAELGLDYYLIKVKGVKDKPLSTIVRAVVMAGLAALNAWRLQEPVAAASFAAMALTFAAIFDPLVNVLVLKRPWNYHPAKPGPSGWWEKPWRMMPGYIELFVRAWLAVTGYIMYVKWGETFLGSISL
jgi:hypothetical protein